MCQALGGEKQLQGKKTSLCITLSLNKADFNYSQNQPHCMNTMLKATPASLSRLSTRFPGRVYKQSNSASQRQRQVCHRDFFSQTSTSFN
jgi:hypothetical protein